jgi:RimJ/RimL family protein N-acetyltransferase
MICNNGVGLRLVLEEDLPLLERWRDDPLTHSMFYSFALMSDSALRNWFRSLLSAPNRMRFMIQRLEDGATIGITGLEHIEYRNQEGELAGLVIDPAERGRGWATKAIGTLTQYAFEDLNLHRLFARIHHSNGGARRVAEKAGLISEGAMRQAVYHDGRYEDLIYMSILREERKHERSTTIAVQ